MQRALLTVLRGGLVCDSFSGVSNGNCRGGRVKNARANGPRQSGEVRRVIRLTEAGAGAARMGHRTAPAQRRNASITPENEARLPTFSHS